MQKKIFINLMLVSLCGFLLTTIMLYFIQTTMAHNMANETFSIRLKNVVERMEQNERQIEELINTTKEDYISRARALAMMIELEPDIMEEQSKMDEVAAALNVDEVHIIDEGGVLRWGTQPEYYGMDFATTDQTRPFLAILEDPAIEIAQDPMPNGSVGLMRQYAGVSLRNKKGIAEIGMVPERLEEALKNNQIHNVLDGFNVGNTGYVFSISTETGAISSHPNQSLVGSVLPEPLKDTGFMNIDGQKVLYQTLNAKDNVLVAVIPTPELYAQRSFYAVIFMGLMIVVFATYCIVVSAYIKRSFINGIYKTVGTLDAISDGNLNVTANVRSNIEFERLSDGINHMLQSIKEKMSEIAALAGDLRRLGAIVAIADAGIIVKDADGIVLEWNIGAENILGYKPEEIIGKTTKAYAPESEHAGIDGIEECLQKGEHIAHVEVVRKHKDGRLIDCSASYTPIFDDEGTFTGSVAIFHDISDKKQIEKSLHDAVLAADLANKAKTSFLANMSHEIRTPLNGIIGFAELAIDDEEVPYKTKDYLNKIMVSGNGLLRIINDILDISKIEAGRMEVEKTPFYMHEVLDFCETISSPKADEKGVLLNFYEEPLVKNLLLGDPTKLRQILLNLLSNAIKFTKGGMVKLIAAAEDSIERGIVIHFEVIDNGIGMTQEQIQKVLEPFMQGDSSTTRKYGGTGLGLSITKNMIELMGGELKVESTPNVGSKFSFALSFEFANLKEEAMDGSEMRTDEFLKPIFKGDVLVCEDNTINQQVIQGHLFKIGLNVTIVSNGKLALDKVKDKKDKPFDLIFMDIHMPVMDGLEASQRLRKMGYESPIIALTANAMAKDKTTYFNCGMTDYLTKPFVARDLWACLLRFLTPVKMVEKNAVGIRDTGTCQQGAVIDRKVGIEQSGEDEELYDLLLLRFYKENINVFEEIINAMDKGDNTLAHRIVHTLKGTAGTMGAAMLREAALAVENGLAGGKNVVKVEEIDNLEFHLHKVLEELESHTATMQAYKIDLAKSNHWKNASQSSPRKAVISSLDNHVLDKEKARGLIKTLTPMLEASNMRCLDALPEIKNVLAPVGEMADTLVLQIENCDLTLALNTLKQIEQSYLY